VGGVYITTRNVKGKTRSEIRRDIAQLQKIQAANGLPPLLITADQEGGIVTRLSPPLPRLPPISSIKNKHFTETPGSPSMTAYAGAVARELAHIGVNINFSPVVDLKPNLPFANPTCRTQLHRRAISRDHRVVSRLGFLYCAALEKAGVIPTLKHFPGLGRVMEDTHYHTGNLDVDIQSLEKTDWLPFRAISHGTDALIMLGHVKLTAVDPEFPVSFSKKVVQKIIRHKWHHDGVLITDDLNMEPAWNSPEGIGGAAVRALNAGVDLLLIARDGNTYYAAMDAVIAADNQNKLNRTFLDRSEKRLHALTRKIEGFLGNEGLWSLMSLHRSSKIEHKAE
jgi:beta-N-acetylhexosaminidase